MLLTTRLSEARVLPAGIALLIVKLFCVTLSE